MERLFLGLDRPALETVVDRLIERHVHRATLDLGQVVIVTPGGRAGRRLAERLFHITQSRGLIYFPPTLATVGRLPEMLYEPKRPFASEWTQRLAWSNAVSQSDAKTRAHLFPGAGSNTSSTTAREWLMFGELLKSCYRELAAEGLSFADVAERGLQMDRFPEADRWMAMATIQTDYLRQLDRLELWDRQTARLEAVRRRECRLQSTLYMLATADLSGTLRSMLDQLDDQAAHQPICLIHAPDEWANRFDPYGCIVAAEWEVATIPLRDDQIVMTSGCSDQAAWVVQSLTKLENGTSCRDVTIGCLDESLLPYVQRALVSQSIRGRWGPGRRVAESGPYRLLRCLRDVLQNGTFGEYATLLRHPDVGDWLRSEGCSEWLPQLDEYERDHLPTRFPDRWLGDTKACCALIPVGDHLRRLVRPLIGNARELSEWSRRVSKFLATVYSSADWSNGHSGGRFAAESALVIQETLAEMMLLSPTLERKTKAAEMLSLVLEGCGAAAVSEHSDDNSIELVGWLELPLDDAHSLIVVGLNEGIVPASGSTDMFLPNSLRRHLEIEDHEYRFARDKYALSVLARSHRDLTLIVGNRNGDGDPLQPSRLLFAEDPDTITRRWLRVLDPSERRATPILIHDDERSPQIRTFGFDVPRPQLVEQLMDTLRPTDFRLYLQCPYRFYLQRVLGLRKMAEETAEMDGSAFGNVVHEVLHKFALSHVKDSADSKAIEKELAGLLDEQLVDRFGAARSAAVRIQREQLWLRLQRFAECQAERRAKGWRIDRVEVPTNSVASIEAKAGTMKLSGRIDRIDVHEQTGDYSIVDYKTSEDGDVPEKTHRKNKLWIDLQLPLYRTIAMAMGLENVTEVGYALLPKRLEDIKFSPAPWGEEDFQSADQQAKQIVQDVLTQKFWPPKKSEFDDFDSILMQGVFERPRVESPAAK